MITTNCQEEQTPNEVKAELRLDSTKSRYLADMRRRGQKAALLNVIADVLVELDLTPDEIKARVQRLFSESA